MAAVPRGPWLVSTRRESFVHLTTEGKNTRGKLYPAQTIKVNGNGDFNTWSLVYFPENLSTSGEIMPIEDLVKVHRYKVKQQMIDITTNKITELPDLKHPSTKTNKGKYFRLSWEGSQGFSAHSGWFLVTGGGLSSRYDIYEVVNTYEATQNDSTHGGKWLATIELIPRKAAKTSKAEKTTPAHSAGSSYVPVPDGGDIRSFVNHAGIHSEDLDNVLYSSWQANTADAQRGEEVIDAINPGLLASESLPMNEPFTVIDNFDDLIPARTEHDDNRQVGQKDQRSSSENVDDQPASKRFCHCFASVDQGAILYTDFNPAILPAGVFEIWRIEGGARRVIGNMLVPYAQLSGRDHHERDVSWILYLRYLMLTTLAIVTVVGLWAQGVQERRYRWKVSLISKVLAAMWIMSLLAVHAVIVTPPIHTVNPLLFFNSTYAEDLNGPFTLSTMGDKVKQALCPTLGPACDACLANVADGLRILKFISAEGVKAFGGSWLGRSYTAEQTMCYVEKDDQVIVDAVAHIHSAYGQEKNVTGPYSPDTAGSPQICFTAFAKSWEGYWKGGGRVALNAWVVVFDGVRSVEDCLLAHVL